MEDLEFKTFQIIKVKITQFSQLTVGKSFTFIFEILEKMYDQHKYFIKLLNKDKQVMKACKRLIYKSNAKIRHNATILEERRNISVNSYLLPLCQKGESENS